MMATLTVRFRCGWTPLLACWLAWHAALACRAGPRVAAAAAAVAALCAGLATNALCLNADA